MSTNIYLIGFMGAGKTTVGTLLADALHRPIVDLDLLFQQTNGSIHELFERLGEAAFRKKEHDLLVQVAQDQNQVIATGGGIVLLPENRHLLEKGCVIFLHSDPKESYRRVTNDRQMIRPLARTSDEKEFAALYDTRYSSYFELADIQVDTTERSPQQVVEVLLPLLEKNI